MVVPVPVGTRRRRTSGIIGEYFAQVEHTGSGGERVEFESDVEPCAICHQLRYQYVFFFFAHQVYIYMSLTSLAQNRVYRQNP